MNLTNDFRLIGLLFFLLFTVNSIRSQTDTELFFKIIDSETKVPISYATIQFVNQGGGVIANEDGGFRLPRRFYDKQERILISSMGYRTLAFMVGKASLTDLNEIELEVRVEELDQVVIKGSKSSNRRKRKILPEEVIQNAINKIPINYPKTPYSTIGYYRDYQLIKNDYFNLNEAIIESFDGGFQTDVVMDKSSQNAIYKYVENSEFKRDSILSSVYDGESKYIENTMISGQGGNELSILNIHNPIRNFDYQSFSFVYHFKSRFLPNHKLNSMRSIYFDDRLIYEISFEAKPNLTGTSHKADGKIYISEDNFAIYKFYYRVSQTKDQKTVFEVDIQYQNKNDRMYLSYITFNNQFNIDQEFTFDVEGVVFDAGDNSIVVNFNNDIDPASIQNKNFRFKYQRKKMMVDRAEVINTRTVKVKIAEWSIPQELLAELKKGDEDTEVAEDLLNNIWYRIKNVYDTGGRKLYQSPELRGIQYREYFVQKVNESTELPKNLEFINKGRPLSESVVNQGQSIEEFWLNTPLKKLIFYYP